MQNPIFYESVDANELSTLIMNDIRDFRSIFSTTLSRLVSGVSVSIVCIVWALTLGWKYSLVGFSMFPLFAIFSIIGTTIVQKFEFSYKDSLNRAESIVYETRVGIKTIMCLNIQQHFLEKFENSLNKVLSEGMKRSIAMGFTINSVYFLANVAQSIMFFYGFTLVARGEYSLVRTMQIVMMILMSVTFITELLTSAHGLYRGLRVAIKLNNLILKREDGINESNGYLTPNLSRLQTEYCISFQNVTFSYPTHPTRSILKNLNMNIPSNKFISIVGESGCGKSTIMSLILRLYSIDESNTHLSPLSQQILVDGYDIDTIKRSVLMSSIAAVTQKHYFFNGTIKENLLYSNPARHAISDENIWSILEDLEMASYVSTLENGIDSLLSVSGNILVSGGQAQRLSIARALLRPASIIVLDECTASLDSHSSEIVLDVLDKFKKYGKSIICITHQEKVMRRSDCIFVIKDGKVHESGHFDELWGQRGALYDMVYKKAAI